MLQMWDMLALYYVSVVITHQFISDTSLEVLELQGYRYVHR